MKPPILKRATAGKIGTVIVGPRHFLNVDILLGEVAVCIAAEPGLHAQPSIWIIGPFDLVDDYLYKVKEEELIENNDLAIIWKRLDDVKKIVVSPFQRLAVMLGLELEELKNKCKIAQVSISSPIQGVRDFSSGKPCWIAKKIS